MKFTAILLILPQILDAIPWDALEPIGEAVLDGQLTREEAIDTLPPTLDALVDWSQVIDSPAGELLEAVDGPAYRFLGGIILGSAVARARRRRPNVRIVTPFARVRPTAAAAAP